MTIFSSVLHRSQIKHQYIVVFEIINSKWGDIILKVHCFHCSNTKATIISSIKVYDWLTSSEYSNLSELKLLIPELIFSMRSSQNATFIDCKSSPTNWSIVEHVFLKELVLSGRNDESLRKSFQLIELQRSVSKHVHSFLVIFDIEFANAAKRL